MLLSPSRHTTQIHPIYNSPMDLNLDYWVANDLYLWMMESYPDTIFVLGDGCEASHRPVEMSNVLQKFCFHI
jgi:hypothetical protein